MSALFHHCSLLRQAGLTNPSILLILFLRERMSRLRCFKLGEREIPKTETKRERFHSELSPLTEYEGSVLLINYFLFSTLPSLSLLFSHQITLTQLLLLVDCQAFLHVKSAFSQGRCKLKMLVVSQNRFTHT